MEELPSRWHHLTVEDGRITESVLIFDRLSYRPPDQDEDGTTP